MSKAKLVFKIFHMTNKFTQLDYNLNLNIGGTEREARHNTEVAFSLFIPAGPGSNHGSGVFLPCCNNSLLRTSEQCKKLNIVDQTHSALVRAVLQKKQNKKTIHVNTSL